jgi:cholesterol oxidase
VASRRWTVRHSLAGPDAQRPGAGWGGGSLVYANVFARPSDETFRPYWPDSYSRATLDRYFDLAAHMLEVGPVQVDPATGDVPVRTRAMEDLVERMDRAAGTVRPKLAVRFSADPNVPLVNRHGVLQHGCTFVGECVIGCNQGAKNSLDYITTWPLRNGPVRSR